MKIAQYENRKGIIFVILIIAYDFISILIYYLFDLYS